MVLPIPVEASSLLEFPDVPEVLVPNVPAWLMFVSFGVCIGAIFVGGAFDGTDGTTRRKHIVNVAYVVVAVTGLTFFVGTL